MPPVVTLRPYHAHERDFFVSLMTDPVVTAHLDGPMPSERAHAIFSAATKVPGAAPIPRVVQALAADDTAGRLIGHAALLGARDLAELLGDPRPPLELGYVLPQASWGRGLGTATARALLAYAQRAHPGRALCATVDVDHPASIRVLEKCGAQRARQVSDPDGDFWLFSWP